MGMGIGLGIGIALSHAGVSGIPPMSLAVPKLSDKRVVLALTALAAGLLALSLFEHHRKLSASMVLSCF